MLPCLLPPSCFRRPRFPCDCCPPLPIPLGTTHSGFVALSTRVRLILVPRNHEPLGCFEDPSVPLARGICCNGPRGGLNSNTNEQCSVDPSVARNTLRPSTRHLCQVYGRPPGLRPSPPVIVANMTPLGNRPLLCRATAPAKRSHHLRMVVSMLSHCVLLSAFAYERVV